MGLWTVWWPPSDPDCCRSASDALSPESKSYQQTLRGVIGGVPEILLVLSENFPLFTRMFQNNFKTNWMTKRIGAEGYDHLANEFLFGYSNGVEVHWGL